MAAVGKGCLGGHTGIPLPVQQNLKREMLYIVKVQQILLPLLLIKGFLKPQGQIHQRIHRRAADPHLLLHLLLCLEKEVPAHLLQFLLHLISKTLGQFPLVRRYGVVLFRGKPVKLYAPESGTEGIIIRHRGLLTFLVIIKMHAASAP